MRLAFFLATLLAFPPPCLAVDSVTPLAPTFAPAPQGPPGTPTSNIVLTPEQFAQLVRAPAPVATTTTTVATTSSPAVISTDGIAGFSWTQILGAIGGLVSLALGAFAVFKGAAWLKARAAFTACVEGAWHIAERVGDIYSLPGAQKAAVALAAFYEQMTGHGIAAITAAQVTQAQALWDAKSAEVHNVTPAVTPEVLAAARAAAQVAAEPGTATALADKAAK